MKWAALAVLAACGGAKAPATAAPRVGVALAAALATADQARVPWRCTAADLPALEAPPMPGWQLADHGITRTGEHAELVVGVIADAGGAAPKTLAALGRLRAQLEDAHVDVVVALGGMGANEHDLEATLGALATPHGLVIALPGDLESVSAETQAIAALRAHGATVLDGRLARWIDAAGVTLATLPGAATPIDPSDGCAWSAGDVTRIYAELSSKPGVRVALLAEAPREEQAGEVSGALALVPTPPIDLVVHGPALPASPERTGGRDGARTRVSPGTADATPRLPMSRPPAAGVLVVRNGTWTWRPLVDR